MTERPEIERAKQVFRFLKAFAERNLPAQRRLADQPWSMILADLPAHPSIVIGEVQLSGGETADSQPADANDTEPLLRVRQPALTPAPRPPAEIADWLQPGWEDPGRRVEPLRERNEQRRRETVTVPFDEAPERTAALEQYRTAWSRWAEAERPARAAMRVFERLYELRGASGSTSSASMRRASPTSPGSWPGTSASPWPWWATTNRSALSASGSRSRSSRHS